MKKVAVALVLILLTMSLASAASQDPRHPLSQVYPTDTNFNMSGYKIFNASRFELQDGLNISGYSFSDAGGVKLLDYDTANSEWNIQNSDIDLNSGVLTDSNGVLTLQNGVEITSGNLDLSGNNITNPNLVNGVDLDNPGNAISVNANRYIIDANSIGNSEIANSESFTFNGVSLTGDLDLNQNNITGIDTLNFVEGTSIDGDIEINGSVNTTGGINLNNDDIDDVRSIDGGGNSVRFDDSINLNGNNLVMDRYSGRIDLGPNSENYREVANSDALSYVSDGDNTVVAGRNGVQLWGYDGSLGTGKQVLDANANGNVEIPNGSIRVQDGGSGWAEMYHGGSRDEVYFDTGWGGFTWNTGDGTDALHVKNGGEVDIPNGNLDLSNNSIIGVSTLRSDSNANTVAIQDEGGVNIVQFDDSGSVTIPNGNLDLNGNSLTGIGGTDCSASEYIGGDGGCKTDNTGTDSQDLSNNLNNSPSVGYVEHDIQITGGSNTVSRDYYEADTDDQTLSTTADVTGTNDQITISGGNSIEIDDDYEANTDNQNLEDVRSRNNTVSGSIDMSSNNIDDVGTLNSNGNTVSTGGTVNVGSGSVTAGQRMCIGDRCT